MVDLQVLGIRIRNLKSTVPNKDGGPISSLSVPNIDMTFDGCIVNNHRTLVIALALQHIQVSAIKLNHNGSQQIIDSQLSSQSFMHTISRILRANPIRLAWRR